MSSDDATLRNHFQLSRECGELTTLLRSEGADSLQLDLKASDLPRFLSEYFYAISPWPVVISQPVRERFCEIVRETPALMSRAILKYYENNLAGFGAHYRLPELAYHLLGEVIADASDILVRYDIVLVDGQPKLLEANVGSNIGGWQTGWLSPQLIEQVKRRPEAADWPLYHPSTIEAFFRHIHHTTHAHVGRKSRGNVFLVFDEFYLQHGLHHEMQRIFERVVAETPWPGKLFADRNLDGLSFNTDGRLVFRGEEVDALLATAASSKRLAAELSRAHIRRLLFFPDNSIQTILGDKANFAILHAVKNAGKLSARESRFVEDNVPWTVFLTETPLSWKGRSGKPAELALVFKDNLVLKRGLSFQGKDVYVGRFHNDAEWAQVVAAAGTTGEWILQEYCRPDRLYAPDEELGVTEHDAVWGVFGFGKKYGGTWGRLMVSETGQGVLNCARGAKEFLILEV